MHREAFAYVQRQLGALNLDLASTDVIELGSYIVNGSVRPLFTGTRAYTGVDVRAGNGVDVVADAADYQHAQPVGLVVSTEMLEHAPDQAGVINNVFNLLAPGGVFIMTAAGVERAPHNNDGHHGIPEDEAYANIAEADLHDWLAAAGFDEIEIVRNVAAGDIYATARRPARTPVTVEITELSAAEIDAVTAPPARKRRSKNATEPGTLR